MGVITFKSKLSTLNQDRYLRLDIDYIEFNKTIRKRDRFLKDYVKDIETGQPISREDYSENGEPTEFIHLVVRNIKNGELNLENPIFINESKGGKLKSFKIEKGDIIIAISANCGASFYFENAITDCQLTLSHYLAKFKVNEDLINPKLLVYYLNSSTLKKYFKATETGKTQKNLSKTYLRELPILLPTNIVEQYKLLARIQSIETEISKLKNLKQKSLNIINQVFGDSFNIPLDTVTELDRINKINVKFSRIHTSNSNLRNGTRWNKMQFVQDKLYERIDCIKVLGDYIKTTKNGWSPLSVEDGEGTPILGQEHFTFDGTLKIEPSKFTEEMRKNIKDFYIKQGDFFVSRGNTVDLVALASIVKDEINDDILFPDLYIRIEFDETKLNKQYIAYLFNSFFGRLYFKYVAKGKNQTMVKISSIELLNFRFPLPDKDLQTEIVEKIKIKIDEQDIFDSQIKSKQQEISKIIADVIQDA
jgi:type I restriction enzyme, S subunit